MARPTKLTAERSATICDARRNGASYAAAAAAAGINEATIYDWKRRGETCKTGIYRDFVDALNLALHEGEALAASVVVAAFTKPSTEVTVEQLADGQKRIKRTTRPPDARMALNFLRAKFGETWNPQHRIALGGDPDGVPVAVEDRGEFAPQLKMLTSAEIDALAAIEEAMTARTERPDEADSVARPVVPSP